MSQTLNLSNFSSSNVLARTKLTSDIAAGISSVGVQNTQGFAAGPITIGNPGQQTTELITALAPTSATAIPVSGTTKLGHNFSDDVLLLFGDSIRIYRANDQYGTGQQPDDSQFSQIATVAINPTSDVTTYIDSAGVSGQWYKYTYINTTTQAETTLANSSATQAGQQHYVSLDDIRMAAGFISNRNVTDTMIEAKRDAAEKEINGALLPVYNFPLPQPTNPIIAEIAKQLAAGMLMHELYMTISPQMAAEGESKADKARNGGGSFTSLQDLVNKDIVLTDASFTEVTIAEIHGFGGYPDATTTDSESNQNAAYFATDMEY